MREIKCRVPLFDARSGDFVKFEYESIFHGIFLTSIITLNNGLIIGDEQQFTGLLDRNGKEIYEGDILKHERNMDEYYYSEIKWIDELSSCGCCFDQFDGCGFAGEKIGKTGFGTFLNKAEIIGNRFEHPELLKVDAPALR